MNTLFWLRLRKLAFASAHRSCWRGMVRGVFASVEHHQALRSLDPDQVLDVGANRGQFALLMRTLHPCVPVVSFEPLPGEAAVFRSVFAADPGVQLREEALGESHTTATIHVSGRADSSSLLPIGELQTRWHPATAEVGTLSVPVRRLDDLQEFWGDRRRILLKLDVQGFELSALQGATRALEHCAWVYVECSEIPFYEGQALAPEVEEFLKAHGFRRIARFNPAWAEGRLVQSDDLYETCHPLAGFAK